MKYLFHGSQCGTIGILKPNISLEMISRVYATDDFAYALVRAGKQLDQIREEYYGPDQPFELAECYPDAFKHQFDCTGYVYLLNPKDFDLDPETGEYKSESEVIPLNIMRIDNIWYWMRICYDERFRFIFDGDEEYWETVRGGKEGFLKRKLANKQKMLELRNRG